MTIQTGQQQQQKKRALNLLLFVCGAYSVNGWRYLTGRLLLFIQMFVEFISERLCMFGDKGSRNAFHQQQKQNRNRNQIKETKQTKFAKKKHE